MTKNSDFLSRIRVASPCPATWNQMRGDERVRFCELCDLQVYNVAQMTTDQLHELVSRGGRVCGRLYRRSDGTVITRDCPSGLQALRRRVVRTASAAFGTLISLASLSIAQSPQSDKSSRQQGKLEFTKCDRNANQQPCFEGIVVDESGAVIPNATVTLTDDLYQLFTVRANEFGQFKFESLHHGRYTLEVTATGFKSALEKQVELSLNQIQLVRIALEHATETVGIFVIQAELETPGEFPSTSIIPKPLKRN